MAIRTELTVRLQNSPGAMGQVCQYLAEGKINVLASSLEPGGTLRLVVDNPLHAAGVLREKRYDVGEHEVLLIALPTAAGSLHKVARLLADAGVNVEYMYASMAEGQPMASVVVGAEDIQRASSLAGL